MRLNAELVDRQGASLDCAWPSHVGKIAQGHECIVYRFKYCAKLGDRPLGFAAACGLNKSLNAGRSSVNFDHEICAFGAQQAKPRNVLQIVEVVEIKQYNFVTFNVSLFFLTVLANDLHQFRVLPHLTEFRVERTSKRDGFVVALHFPPADFELVVVDRSAKETDERDGNQPERGDPFGYTVQPAARRLHDLDLDGRSLGELQGSALSKQPRGDKRGYAHRADDCQGSYCEHAPHFGGFGAGGQGTTELGSDNGTPNEAEGGHEPFRLALDVGPLMAGGVL